MNRAADFKILIVEDQTTDIVGPYLLASNLGFTVKIAFDGEQALYEISADQYDLIILDWNMPVRSGLELLRAIERQNISVKVILHSGESLSQDELYFAENIQILDVWNKPMSPVAMLKRIKALREMKEIAA